jgi:protein-disulfide isomerase
MALASKVGADSTPTFILNGDKLEQDVWGDDDKLSEALDEAIAE